MEKRNTTKETKQVKVSSKSKTHFYLTIYDLLKLGIKPSHTDENGQEKESICSKLGMSKQRLNWYLSSLKKAKIINKKDKVWTVLKDLSQKELIEEVTKNFPSKSEISLGTIGPTFTNLHALQINFPILEGKIEGKDWREGEKLKNWLPKYKNLDILGGLTLKNNNNKSITVFCKSRDLLNIEEVDQLAFKLRSYIFEYFKSKYGVILDVFEAKVTNINLATEDKASEGMLRKGEKFELDLNKKSEKILPKDDINAKAWIDGSPFTFTAETNDKEWKREYLRMPFTIRDLGRSQVLLERYNRNLELHIKVQKEQLKTQKQIQELLKTLHEKQRG